jgi:hypothetical protein
VSIKTYRSSPSRFALSSLAMSVPQTVKNMNPSFGSRAIPRGFESRMERIVLQIRLEAFSFWLQSKMISRVSSRKYQFMAVQSTAIWLAEFSENMSGCGSRHRCTRLSMLAQSRFDLGSIGVASTLAENKFITFSLFYPYIGTFTHLVIHRFVHSLA